MICKQCNNNVPIDSEYCPFCGNIVEKVIAETNPISDVDKGYTYLELKEWKKAKEVFDFAIVNNDNKARAYIGRLLARLKLSDLASLSSVNKKLTKFDDFKMAVKYADDNYKQQLKKYYSLVEDKINQKKVKSKKRAIISSISSISLIVLLVLTYFVFIPLGRFSYYQNLLSKGKIEKATKSFSDSKWFEFDEKAEELFYNKGVSLVENKDYKNAEFCFDITKDFKDSNNYYTYCKAQNLLAENDLESYNYFTKCKDFLDSKSILETNEYFVLVDRLQGLWKTPTKTLKETEKNLIDNGWIINTRYLDVEEPFLWCRTKENSIDGYRQDLYTTKIHSMGITGLNVSTLDVDSVLAIKEGKLIIKDTSPLIVFDTIEENAFKCHEVYSSAWIKEKSILNYEYTKWIDD